MVKYCSAFGCNNKRNSKKRSEGVSFFGFPLKKPEQLRAWVAGVRREGFKPTINSHLCSDHFLDSDFSYHSLRGRRELKEGAVPSVIKFSTLEKTRTQTTYEFEQNVLSITEHESEKLCTSDSESLPTSVSVQTDLTMTDLKKWEDLSNKYHVQEMKLAELKHNPLSVDHMGDKSVKDLTGFSLIYFGILFSYFKLDEALETKTRPCLLSKRNQFFMTLVRLRQGFTEKVLGILFNINTSTVNKVFNKCITILYTRAHSTNIWPPKHQIKRYMPPIFQDHLPSCRVIIDVTEFYTQKPIHPSKQQASCKNYSTVKALIGITPSGAISFISDLWMGSISDKELTIKSGLLHLLEEGDTVLADRGFTSLQDEFQKKGVSMFTPTFLKDKILFPLEERRENKRVSSHRCHVERAIGRIKNFKFLDGVIPNSIKNLQEIYYICTFLCNFYENPLITIT